MRTRIALATTTLLCLATASGYSSELPFLEPQSEYAATRIIETSEGNFRQRLYWTEDKIRTETEIEGVTLTNIVRQDLGVVWLSNPQMGRCLEQPVGSVDDMSQIGSQYSADDVDARELGTEIVDGHETTKYEVTPRDPGAEGQRAFFWVTGENILVRMEMIAVQEGTEIAFRMRLADLELGNQDEALFESPGDCVSMSELQRPPSPTDTP